MSPHKVQIRPLLFFTIFLGIVQCMGSSPLKCGSFGEKAACTKFHIGTDFWRDGSGGFRTYVYITEDEWIIQLVRARQHDSQNYSMWVQSNTMPVNSSWSLAWPAFHIVVKQSVNRFIGEMYSTMYCTSQAAWLYWWAAGNAVFKTAWQLATLSECQTHSIHVHSFSSSSYRSTGQSPYF